MFFRKDSHLSILLYMFSISIKSSQASFEDFRALSVWEKFWSVSCEFSTIVTRSKRSVIQEPNFDNPMELFDYLYPLADVTVESYIASEQRSAKSIFTWTEDLIELWESECHVRRRREKRAADEGENGMNENNDNWKGENLEDDDSPFPYENHHNFKNVTTSTTPTPVVLPKKQKKVFADTDTFFAQYGGDIEYFFPLISFGVPFDGEITLLGFHGFKGLFPYK